MKIKGIFMKTNTETKKPIDQDFENLYQLYKENKIDDFKLSLDNFADKYLLINFLHTSFIDNKYLKEIESIFPYVVDILSKEDQRNLFFFGYGNVDKLKKLIDYGVDLESLIFLDGYTTPLMSFIKNNYTECAKELIAAKINVGFKDLYGQNALMVAADVGSTELVKLLLREGIDVNVNAQDNNGDTALNKAIKSESVDIVRLLMKAGADPSIENSDGKSASMIAKEIGNTEVIEVLVGGYSLDRIGKYKY